MISPQTQAATRAAEPTSGDWQTVPTIRKAYDGTLQRTWGVQVRDTGQWIAQAHPIGPGPHEQEQAHANALLLGASKAMARVLTEALEAWAQEFDGAPERDLSISGADFIDWFTQWRMDARAALGRIGAP